MVLVKVLLILFYCIVIKNLESYRDILKSLVYSSVV